MVPVVSAERCVSAQAVVPAREGGLSRERCIPRAVGEEQKPSPGPGGRPPLLAGRRRPSWLRLVLKPRRFLYSQEEGGEEVQLVRNLELSFC